MALPRSLSSLRHRNARRFFFGMLVSNVGTWIQSTATSVVVFRLTGRATDVGITLLCQFLPMLLLGAWAGAVADRVDKRKMAIITQAGMGAQALVLGVLELSGNLTLPAVYVLSAVLGVLAALDNPARRGYVLETVEPSEITNAVSLNTAVMTGSRIFGPALAALLIDPLGAGWLFVLNGVSFLAVLVSLVFVDESQLHRSPTAPRGGQPVRDGLRYLWRDRRLRIIYLVFIVIGTFAFNYSVSLLKLSAVRFGDERIFGWLLAVTSIGSLTGSLVMAGRTRVGSVHFVVAGVLLGVSGLALAWSPSVWVAAALGVPLGAGGAALIASLNAITQQQSPPDMRGRLLALGAVAFLGTTPIGAPITGWVADRVSAEWSLAYGSVITLVSISIGAVLLRPRARGALVPSHQGEAIAAADHHADAGGVVVQGGGAATG
jgi:MFS family permease